MSHLANTQIREKKKKKVADLTWRLNAVATQIWNKLWLQNSEKISVTMPGSNLSCNSL